jgi:hypothetical protein
MHEQNEILTEIGALRREIGARLDDLDARLRRVEAEPAAAAAQPAAAAKDYEAEPVPSVPTSTVEVTIRPLNDVSRVRVVEEALTAIDGVESVSLQTLSGDTAELEAEVQENVSLIGGLRRTLPLAFDVSESSDSSFTIALAEAAADDQLQGDAVANKAS